jgi:predicted DCC family thiol-disulfide oxidoreductase YuxK
MPQRSDPLVVLFDADCGACVWTVAFAVRLGRPGALRAVPLDSAEAERHLADLPPEARWGSWHAVGESGHRTSGGAVLPHVLRRIRGGGPLASLLDATPRLTEALYRTLARNRHIWGRLVPRRSVAAARTALPAATNPDPIGGRWTTR